MSILQGLEQTSEVLGPGLSGVHDKLLNPGAEGNVITIETLFAEPSKGVLPSGNNSVLSLLELNPMTLEQELRPWFSSAPQGKPRQSSMKTKRLHDDTEPAIDSCTYKLKDPSDVLPPILTVQDIVRSQLNHHLFRNEYIEVRRSSIAGYGVFARKQLRQGDIILREKAVFKAEFGSVEKAFRLCNEETRRVVRRLYANNDLKREQSLIKAIWTTNCFAVNDHEAGLFAISSRFNHTCDPSQNVIFKFDTETDCLIFQVKDSIVEVGKEITISYGQGYSPRRLFANFRFRCACGTCKGLTAQEAKSMLEW